LTPTTSDKIILRDLGDGLILRHGRAADAEELADFNAFIFRNTERNEPNERLAWWTRDLALSHATVKPEDFTVVEDTRSGKIVSSFVWISQRWSYDGIEFGVGRPEMVGTHPDYRNRGVVRAQFEVAHEWSAQRNEMIQVITGIPYFYRQFGYEMTMQLGGGRAGYKVHLPKLKKDEAEPYTLRPATLADLPFIMSLYAQRAQRSLVDCVRDEAMWRYELEGKSEKNVNRVEFRIVETPQGEAVGLLGHPVNLWGQTMTAVLYEVKAGTSWVAVTPSVMRYLWATGEAFNERDKKDGVNEMLFALGLNHPVYDAMKDHLPRLDHPYAWYIRVPDIVAFLRHIAPALERHLAASVVAGHSGELKLSFYRSGAKLTFEQGRIASIEPWKPTADDGGSAAFPGYTFLQVLFGWRSLDEVRYAFPDCWAGGNASRALVDALFPKRDSEVWPIA
jgi:hypothetical protein